MNRPHRIQIKVEIEIDPGYPCPRVEDAAIYVESKLAKYEMNATSPLCYGKVSVRAVTVTKGK